jgi:hypothetical protein
MKNRTPLGRSTRRWLAVGILGLVAVPACGDAFGIEDVLGIWNAQSIGGHAVPGTVVYEGVSYDTEYVRWTFYEGGHCTLTQLVDGITATYDDCDYTVDMARRTISIVFLYETWDGSVDEGDMTLTDPQDVVWLLRQQ